jgi:hypothetical protein
MMTSAAINLDCHTIDAAELMSFWFRHQGVRRYRDLFPQGGKGTKRATADLANYASNKATAMLCRMRCDTTAALVYERICDDIYDRLPPFAKW